MGRRILTSNLTHSRGSLPFGWPSRIDGRGQRLTGGHGVRCSQHSGELCANFQPRRNASKRPTSAEMIIYRIVDKWKINRRSKHQAGSVGLGSEAMKTLPVARSEERR